MTLKKMTFMKIDTYENDIKKNDIIKKYTDSVDLLSSPWLWAEVSWLATCSRLLVLTCSPAPDYEQRSADRLPVATF